MRIYTAHLRDNRPPVLVREGFSWGALIFGPLWLLAHRAWIAGVLALCADLLLAFVTHGAAGSILLLAEAWMIGLFGHDMLRWSLTRQGYLESLVIAAPDADTAFARVLERRPDLIGEALR